MRREGGPRPAWGRERRPTGNYFHPGPSQWGRTRPPAAAPRWAEPQNGPFKARLLPHTSPLHRSTTTEGSTPTASLKDLCQPGASEKRFRELIRHGGTWPSPTPGGRRRWQTHPQLLTAIRLETSTKG